MKPIVFIKKNYTNPGSKRLVFVINLKKALCVNMRLDNYNMVFQMRKLFGPIYGFALVIPKSFAYGRYDISFYSTYFDGSVSKALQKEFFVKKGE